MYKCLFKIVKLFITQVHIATTLETLTNLTKHLNAIHPYFLDEY